MSGPRRQTPWLPDVTDGQGQAAGKPVRAGRISGGALQGSHCLHLALPTTLDHGDEGDEHRADPEADKRTLAQLEHGTKALQMTSKG